MGPTQGPGRGASRQDEGHRPELVKPFFGCPWAAQISARVSRGRTIKRFRPHTPGCVKWATKIRLSPSTARQGTRASAHVDGRVAPLTRPGLGWLAHGPGGLSSGEPKKGSPVPAHRSGRVSSYQKKVHPRLRVPGGWGVVRESRRLRHHRDAAPDGVGPLRGDPSGDPFLG